MEIKEMTAKELKEALVKAGLIEDVNFQLNMTDNNEMTISINVPMKETSLPEILAPYAPSDDEIERAIWKKNTEKKSFAGGRFELALYAYADEQFSNQPEIKKMDEDCKKLKNISEFNEWNKTKQEHWKNFCETETMKELFTILENDYI